MFNPLIATLKPQSNGPSYSNTVIDTLAVDEWAVIFGTARRGPGLAGAPPSPLLAVPNVTAHLSTASVPTSYYLMWRYNRLLEFKGLMHVNCIKKRNNAGRRRCSGSRVLVFVRTETTDCPDVPTGYYCLHAASRVATLLIHSTRTKRNGTEIFTNLLLHFLRPLRWPHLAKLFLLQNAIKYGTLQTAVRRKHATAHSGAVVSSQSLCR